ncbi:hypothetical protein ATK17_2903 [Branchiibius hedensis]|uniref:Uncharacterized protein n=1 Tax=Branchiibius hedensis TaxID=672460 RepID=A0A2Y8ZT35_9MICO|nr:hypothetical protein ATK17_2903 [Branchiibius hedensis]SSA35540.1 hypothetical protein SAMN04489750_2903 [Branchiibius hedensis]
MRVETIEDPTSAVAQALIERFEATAAEKGGWLDQHVR